MSEDPAVEPGLIGTGAGLGPSSGTGGVGLSTSGVGDEPVIFANRIVDFSPGPGAGFGRDRLPQVVLGPPQGAGRLKGSLDVLSLGLSGTITLTFDQLMVDGPGPDFVVYENPFIFQGNGLVFAEPAEVSVSENGRDFRAFPCTPTRDQAYRGCAGVRPVLASTTAADGMEGAQSSPQQMLALGGDAFDLADIGLARVRFVRIRDTQAVSSVGTLQSEGFDLDALAVLNHRPR